MKRLTDIQCLVDWMRYGCKYFHMSQRIEDGKEEMWCDRGHALHYGKVRECVECKERVKEH